MIIDLTQNKKHTFKRYDICIVGSGPAGLTIANELSNSGLSVCVLESGKKDKTKYGDGLRETVSEGIKIKEYSRERVFGGTSMTWAGLSSLFTELDLKTRTGIDYSGWPIEYEDLLFFYNRAAKNYDFPEVDYFRVSNIYYDFKKHSEFKPLWKKLNEKIFLANSNPQRFGKKFLNIFNREGVDLFLDATLVDLHSEGDKVSCVTVKNSIGESFNIESDDYVLATGGIENARILLSSKNKCPQGLGNENDQVGRYLMNHPKNNIGTIKLKEGLFDAPYYFGFMYKGFAGYAGLEISEEIRNKSNLLHSYIRFEPVFPWSKNNGVESFVSLIKKSETFFRTWKKTMHKKLIALRDYSETGDDSDLQNKDKNTLDFFLLFKNIFSHLPSILMYIYYRIIPGAVPKIYTVNVRNFMEMAPRPENRIILGDKKNDIGQNIPIVRHHLSELDKKSLIELHYVLGEEIKELGVGTFENDLKKIDWSVLQDASHHMGTTRMGNDSKTSVVDSNCKIHTVDNVYLAGASIFPTSGCINPTFTVVALSIRLAEYLKKKHNVVLENN